MDTARLRICGRLLDIELTPVICSGVIVELVLTGVSSPTVHIGRSAHSLNISSIGPRSDIPVPLWIGGGRSPRHVGGKGGSGGLASDDWTTAVRGRPSGDGRPHVILSKTCPAQGKPAASATVLNLRRRREGAGWLI